MPNSCDNKCVEQLNGNATNGIESIPKELTH
jgi:hypothetical protein